MGVLLKIENIQPAEKGFIIQIQSRNKVFINKLSLDKDGLYAEYSDVEDQIDLDKQNHKLYLKKLINQLIETKQKIKRNREKCITYIVL